MIKQADIDYIRELRDAEKDKTFLLHNIKDAFRAVGATVHVMPRQLIIEFSKNRGLITIINPKNITCRKPAGLGMYNIINSILRQHT